MFKFWSGSRRTFVTTANTTRVVRCMSDWSGSIRASDHEEKAQVTHSLVPTKLEESHPTESSSPNPLIGVGP
ncbi:MAG: hypothetical protein MI923_07100 [Phycisphaerales bacterium]|nr:hypothetical protein [Phycisphaerales bacterium]